MNTPPSSVTSCDMAGCRLQRNSHSFPGATCSESPWPPSGTPLPHKTRNPGSDTEVGAAKQVQSDLAPPHAWCRSLLLPPPTTST